MLEIRKTQAFSKWLDGLRDLHARARILVRIERLAEGNAGDVKPVGEGVSEMKIDYGVGIECISQSAREQVSYCCVVVTNEHKMPISHARYGSHL